MILGGENVDISLVLIRFSEKFVFVAGMFFERFLCKIKRQKACIGESHELKTVEILVRN